MTTWSAVPTRANAVGLFGNFMSRQSLSSSPAFCIFSQLLLLIPFFPTREAAHGLPEWINVEVSHVIISFLAITTHSKDFWQ